MVAGPGFAPGPGAYETPEVLDSSIPRITLSDCCYALSRGKLVGAAGVEPALPKERVLQTRELSRFVHRAQTGGEGGI